MARSNEGDLRNFEKEAKKLRKKLKRADLDYAVSISINSGDSDTINYTLSMTSPAKGLAPIMFIAHTPERLIEYIKAAQENFDEKAIEIAYHKAQIDSCERTKQAHEERIEELEKPEEEIEETNNNEDTTEEKPEDR